MRMHDSVETRLCRQCKSLKPVTHFYKHRKHLCKTCYRENGKAWKKKHPQLVRAQQRRWSLKHRTRNINARISSGLSPGWYDDQLKRQKGRCAACGDRFSQSNKRKMACIHHSHAHGDVRHLLCRDCNLAEGFLQTPERARRLWVYMMEDELFYSNHASLEKSM